MAKAGQRAKHDEAKLAAKTGPILDLSELLVRYPPGGTQNAYGNIVIVNWTLHDVRIRFSELMYAADPHAPRSSNQIGVLEERVGVTIPWHQAKVLRDNLNAAIAAYEKVNGELIHPQLPYVD